MNARRTRFSAFAAAACLALLPAAGALAGGEAVSEWSNGYNSRVRLSTGVEQGAAGRLVAGIEIETQPDWKTYWRNPGDAGVPPSFDWSKSENLAGAEVLYPAPRRFTEKSGTTIGYLGRVLFPVIVTAADPAKPVSLRLSIEYGVCKEICVPASAELSAAIMPGAAPPPAPVAETLAGLPSPRGRERSSDPVIEDIAVETRGASPRIVLDVGVPGGPDGADAFLVASDGGFVPLAVRAPGAAPGKVRFVVDLGKDVDLKDLVGKQVVAVVTGPGGATEATIPID